MGRERSDDGWYFCDFCGDEFETELGLLAHRAECDERPGDEGTEWEPIAENG